MSPGQDSIPSSRPWAEGRAALWKTSLPSLPSPASGEPLPGDKAMRYLPSPDSQSLCNTPFPPSSLPPAPWGLARIAQEGQPRIWGADHQLGTFTARPINAQTPARPPTLHGAHLWTCRTPSRGASSLLPGGMGSHLSSPGLICSHASSAACLKC